MDPWTVTAGGYDAAMWLSGWHRAQRSFAADLTGTVLDMGCGTAYLATLLGDRYVGLDRSLTMLVRAPGRVVAAEAAAAPFGDAAFDTVISTGFLGLLDVGTRAAVLSQMARVTRGRVRVLEPVARHTRWPLLALARHPLGLEEFTRAGLEVTGVGPLRYAGVYTTVCATRRR